MAIDITNREALNSMLNNLNENTKPIWGRLKAQNMIEHLATVLQYSNGKKRIAQRTTEEEGQKAKEAFIYSDVPMSMGLKSPLLPEDGPIPFEFANLEEARKELNKQLDDFEAYHREHPDALFVQPRLGKLNYKEWIVFHNKHFTHHFKQFGLVD